MKFSIISGAPDQSSDFLKNNIDLNSFIIAADSGYIHSKNAGITPDLIVGDFDSSVMPQDSENILQLPKIKNDTDTFYCIKEAIKRGADEIEIFCAIGSRADHSYSNLLALNYCLDNNVKAKIIDSKNIISVHNKSFEIHKSEFKYFSLFAFIEDVEGLTITGAAYNLNNKTLLVSDPLGQSNEFKDDKVNIDFTKGKIMLILSND